MKETLASLRRENAELKRRLALATKLREALTLNTWTVPGSEIMRTEILTATRLGFTVDVRVNRSTEELILTAMYRVQA